MQLNEKQEEFVKSDERRIVVVAGPGTGKTRALAEKIKYLINRGVGRNEILTLTFTKKAAKEIKERVNLRDLEIDTFHSFSYRLLEGKDQKEIKIAEDEQTSKILDEIIGRSGGQWGADEIKLKISKIKTSKEGLVSLNTRTKEIFEEYQKILGERGLRDYDDLLLESVGILKKDKRFCERYKWVLVDEFQDTNEVQYEIVKLLARDGNLAVIGDPAQSIYAFRGATPGIFERFKADNFGYKEIFFEINYRNGERILRASNELFGGRSFCCKRSQPGEVSLIHTLNSYSEAYYLINFIKEKVGGTNLIEASEMDGHGQRDGFNDFAVCFRTHNFSRALEKGMRESGMPYQMVGAKSLFQKEHIRKIIEVVRLLIGEEVEVDEEVLLVYRKLIKKVVGLSVGEVIELIIESMGLREKNKGKTDLDFDLSDLVLYSISFESEKQGLKEFIKYIDFLKENNFYDERAERVTLTTLHATKGLEFKYVFICGFEDGVIPYIKKDSLELEEERRLLYVAMTRAKVGLCLIYCDQRGKKKRKVSRFLNELGEQVEEVYDAKAYKREERRRIKRLKESQVSLF